jgi:MoxR-like ATPase
MSERLQHLQDILRAARAEVGKVVIGQDEAVDAALIAVFTNQHALVEGVPGVGKTLLVRALAKALGTGSGRIQFTPDLMPSDITGTHVFDLRKQEFSLVQGPVFNEFLLADEINRAPAKTQAALLQAMQERTVSIDRTTYALPENFTVFATQNPIEFEGTYPLPEAQKDRFLLKITMGVPARDAELDLARRTLGADRPELVLAAGAVAPVLGGAQLTIVRQALDDVVVREEILAFAVDLVRRTREHPNVLVGAGPRGTQALLTAARAVAAIAGRDFVTPDDVRDLARPVLEHRLILRPEYEIEGLDATEVVGRIVGEVPVPR